MTTAPAAEINGHQVSLAVCDWVLWAPCGCPIGVTVARSARTEDAAWRAFYDYKREIAVARQLGARMELMTHERWSAEVMARMKARCPHGT